MTAPKLTMPIWIAFNKDRKVLNVFMTKNSAEAYLRRLWGSKRGTATIEEHEVLKDNVDTFYLGRATTNIAYNDRVYYNPGTSEVFMKQEAPSKYEKDLWRYNGEDEGT